MERGCRPVLGLALFLAFFPGPARAGHPVLIGVRETDESAILAQIAAEMVRNALDVPYVMEPPRSAMAAWKALQQGALDVYPESIEVLSRQILTEPVPATTDRLRLALRKHQMRMTDPVGFGGIVLVYRADLPDRAPASAAVLLKMQGLITAEEMRQLVALAKANSRGNVAADFLQRKIAQSTPRRSGANLLFLAAGLLVGVLAIRIGWGRLRFTERRAAAPAPAVPPYASPCPTPARH